MLVCVCEGLCVVFVLRVFCPEKREHAENTQMETKFCYQSESSLLLPWKLKIKGSFCPEPGILYQM